MSVHGSSRTPKFPIADLPESRTHTPYKLPPPQNMAAPGAPLPSSFDDDADFYEESRLAKLTRRLREEPLIPLGCLLTCWALFGATKQIRLGDHNAANRMFRRRIYAQGFTIAAMFAGSVYWQSDREKRKEWNTLNEEKKRVEKRDKWLAELEARDEEDKAYRAKLERAINKRRENAAKTADGSDGSSEPAQRSGGGVTDAVQGLFGGRKS